MTFTESIVNYINNSPDVPHVDLDMLPPDREGNALCPAERDITVKAYINGTALKRFTAALYSCRMEADKLEAIKALQALQTALEELKGQVLDNSYQIEKLDFTTSAIKNRTGKWVFYGSTATIEYKTI